MEVGIGECEPIGIDIDDQIQQGGEGNKRQQGREPFRRHESKS